jgi:hypothetical protein
MLRHARAGQADAVEHEITAFDRARGLLGARDIGAHLLGGDVPKRAGELVTIACDDPHGDRAKPQRAREVKTRGAGGAENRGALESQSAHRDGASVA